MVIGKVKIIVISFLCRREGKLTWDWLLFHIDRTFLHRIQGPRLLPFCVSVIACGSESSTPNQQKGKRQSRKPLSCFLKVLTRNDTDHFWPKEIKKKMLPHPLFPLLPVGSKDFHGPRIGNSRWKGPGSSNCQAEECTLLSRTSTLNC